MFDLLFLKAMLHRDCFTKLLIPGSEQSETKVYI
jgi:hypothetical protein